MARRRAPAAARKRSRLAAEAAVQRKPLSTAGARKYPRNSYRNLLRSRLQPSSDRPQFSIRFPLEARTSPLAARQQLRLTCVRTVAKLRPEQKPQDRQTGPKDPIPAFPRVRLSPLARTSLS